VSEGFVRLSAGCEAIQDLLADIGQALDSTRS
jgi:cystathionine beta-lyase/cystathionine gamma-synthase